MELSEDEILSLNRLLQFLRTSFKGSTVNGWKIDDAADAIEHILKIQSKKQSWFQRLRKA